MQKRESRRGRGSRQHEGKALRSCQASVRLAANAIVVKTMHEKAERRAQPNRASEWLGLSGKADFTSYKIESLC